MLLAIRLKIANFRPLYGDADHYTARHSPCGPVSALLPAEGPQDDARAWELGDLMEQLDAIYPNEGGNTERWHTA
jgi:hypothetical protein